MKLAAQIFIIIGMVVGFWTILPLVFGIMALVKMKEGKPATWLNLRKKKIRSGYQSGADLLFHKVNRSPVPFYTTDCQSL